MILAQSLSFYSFGKALILLLKQHRFAPLFDQVANAALAVQKVEMKYKNSF
jgi:hypothetical protein